MSSKELSQRDKEILKTIVRTFILTGEPVPSSTISRLLQYDLSSASIRSIMAKLEEEGYLTQPHHAAGRIPTDLGYRFYVDSMSRTGPFSKKDADEIHSDLNRTGGRYPGIFIEASRILSKCSHNIGVVLSPDVSNILFEHIDFMRLGYGRIMVIFIARHGILSDRIIEDDEDYSQFELNRISSYLDNRMKGKTLREVRDEIVRMMNDDKEAYDSMIRNAAFLAFRYFEGETGKQDLFLEGTLNLFDKPEFTDSEKMKALFKAFEEKNRIVKLLNLCLEAEGVKVTIGSESCCPELSECSIITSSCMIEEQPLGVVGIIGPRRMEYRKTISLVGYLSRLMSTIIQRNHERDAATGGI
jgi:heat-inducible transcriptional repressor